MKKLTLKKELFMGYLIVLVWILLFKMSRSVSDIVELSNTIRNINLMSFKESTIVNGQLHYSEIINNLIIFIPFGGLLGIIDKKHTFAMKSVTFLLFSLMIEILQFIFGLGATDITDLLANTLGGIVGLFIYQLLKKLFNEEKLDRILVGVGTGLLSICLVLIGLMLFINRV